MHWFLNFTFSTSNWRTRRVVGVIMPKYALDEKGILTITSEHDGGIFTIKDVLKIITMVLFVVSIVSSVGIYGFFYYDAPTTNTATDYCISRISDYDCFSLLATIPEKCELGFCFGKIFSRIYDYLMYYWESLVKMFIRGKDLVSYIYDRIELYRYKWR